MDEKSAVRRDRVDWDLKKCKALDGYLNPFKIALMGVRSRLLHGFLLTLLAAIIVAYILFGGLACLVLSAAFADAGGVTSYSCGFPLPVLIRLEEELQPLPFFSESPPPIQTTILPLGIVVDSGALLFAPLAVWWFLYRAWRRRQQKNNPISV